MGTITIEEVVKRRLLAGSLETRTIDGQVHIPYDALRVRLVRSGVLEVLLMQRDDIIASVENSLYEPTHGNRFGSLLAYVQGSLVITPQQEFIALTAAEAAAFLKVHKATVQAMARPGVLSGQLCP